MQGWIKLHRKMVKWEWYQEPSMVHLFLHLILLANHDPQKWQGIQVNRGQLITGRKKLSQDTGISEQTIRTCLKRLKSTSEITIKPTNRFSLITVCNYSSYNSKENSDNTPINQPANQQSTNSQPATNQQLTTNKNVKKEKNVKKTTLPDNLNTPEFHTAWEQWKQYRTEKRNKLTPSTITAQLKKLSEYPVATAIATIERSIEKGWTGLFPDKEQNNGRKTIPQNERKTPEQQSTGVLGSDFGDQESEYGTSIEV